MFVIYIVLIDFAPVRLEVTKNNVVQRGIMEE